MATVKIGISASDEGFKSTMQSASRAVADLGSAMSGSAKQFTTVNGALRAARKEAIELTAQWRALDEEAKNSDFGQSLQAQLQSVLQTAGELQDIKGDVANEIKNLASDTTMWDGMSQGIGVVSSSMQGLAGVVGLVGGDVQAFTQALTVMNTVQSVTNTIIGIGNALQKDSALMTALRAAKTAILATAEGTAATAIGAETAATEAQTVAQIANNAAVMANPYVLAAMAIVALTAAIVAWVASSDEATESELSLAAATEAMSEQMDTAYKQTGDQIAAIMQLKEEFDNCGGSISEIDKKIVKNTKLQKQAGVVIKNTDQAIRLLSTEGVAAFIRGANARAMAMAAEAAIAATYAKVLKELNDALNKIGSGQEINIADVEKLANELGIATDRFKEMARAAGYYEEHVGPFARNNLRLKEGVDALEAQQDLIQSMFEYSRTNGTLSSLSKMAENWKQQAKTEFELGGIDDIVIDPDVDISDKSTKAHKTAQKNHAQTNAAQKKTQELTKQNLEQIKQTLNTLEGCEGIIRQADQEMKKLNKTSADYNEKLKELKNIKLLAQVKKLEFIDQSTLKGLTDYKKTIKAILEELPDGSPQIENLNKMLDEANDKIKRMHEEKASSNIEKDLEDLASFYKELLKEMSTSAPDYSETLNALKEVERKLKDIKQTQDDLTNGVQQYSKAWYKRVYEEQLKAVESLEANTPIAANGSPDMRRYTGADMSMYGIDIKYLEQALRDMYDSDALENVLQDIQDEHGNPATDVKELEGIWQQTLTDYKEWLKNKVAAMSTEQQAWVAPHINIDTTFDYKKSENEKLDTQIEALQNAHDQLQELLKNNQIAPAFLDEAKKDLSEYERMIKEFQRSKVFNEMAEDIKEYQTSVRDGFISAAKSVSDGMETIYNVISSLPDKLDDCENGFEAFFEVMGGIFSIVDSVVSIIDTFRSLSEAIGLLSGATEAQNMMTQKQTAGLSEQLIILGALETAQTTKMATDQAAIVPEGEKAAAAKLAANAFMEEAAAAMFAAHAEIPFVGAALGAAEVGVMLGTMAGVKAAQMLAGGGIVQGSTTMGDRMLVGINAGEMVLNKRQQSNLFKALDEGIGSTQGYTVSNVRVKGSDLYLALKNYSKIKGKSGITTGIQ